MTRIRGLVKPAPMVRRVGRAVGFGTGDVPTARRPGCPPPEPMVVPAAPRLTSWNTRYRPVRIRKLLCSNRC
jgi:hypothetical protein